MAGGIQLRITELHNVQVYADRSADIIAVDAVRGPIKISLQEDDLRYLWACMMDSVPMEEWRKADEAEDA